jgi:hypothetical protein
MSSPWVPVGSGGALVESVSPEDLVEGCRQTAADQVVGAVGGVEGVEGVVENLRGCQDAEVIPSGADALITRGSADALGAVNLN